MHTHAGLINAGALEMTQGLRVLTALAEASGQENWEVLPH